MLTYHLDRSGKESLYAQLYRLARADIERGAIAGGQRLPAKRALAEHLGVSVITVEGAYRQLLAEGYIRSEPRRGFFACSLESTGTRERLAFSDFPAESRPEAPAAPFPFADFTGATAPQGIFPYTAWARTMRTVLSAESERTLLEAGEAQGSLPLRQAIAAHLQGARGLTVHPDQIVIGSGAQTLYGLLVQLLGRQRTYAVENPGYPRLASIYRSNDVPPAAVGMDSEGPRISDLEASGAQVLHCMPSHQFPTGITTSAGRRRQILAWATVANPGGPRYIIEDDYDCEFRMSGRPIPPLAAMDSGQRVIYTNTFTKTLGAAFRIGYMVLPPHLAQRFSQQLSFYNCTVGALEQLTLARFMESGQYERHVNRQRTHFRKVQNALVRALAEADADHRISLRNTGAGLHFLMEASRSAADERAIAQQALQNGVVLSPLRDYCLFDSSSQAPAPRPATFVMNFASLRPQDAPRAASVIAEAIN